MAKKSRKQPNPRRSVEAARKKPRAAKPAPRPEAGGDRSRVGRRFSRNGSPLRSPRDRKPTRSRAAR